MAALVDEVEGTTIPPEYRIDPPPCKHEWRQYMEVGQWDVPEPHQAFGLMPDGFFCIHCTERRD